MSTRKIIREVRAEIADMHEQSTHGMWGDYGEPMLVGEDLLRALSLLWRVWPNVAGAALPGATVLELLDRLEAEAEEEE